MNDTSHSTEEELGIHLKLNLNGKRYAGLYEEWSDRRLPKRKMRQWLSESVNGRNVTSENEGYGLHSRVHSKMRVEANDLV